MDERLIQVRELLSKGDLEGALREAEGIKESYWRDYALRWVVEAYVTRSPEKALEIAGKIRTETLHDEVFKNLSYLLSRAGIFKLAIGAARSIKSDFLRKKALKSVADVLARVIVEKGTAGVSLGELGLDERDLEQLKPLPAGLIFKDGKLMPGAELLRMKGEMKSGIIQENKPQKAGPPKPAVKPFHEVKKSYLQRFFSGLVERGDVEGLEYWTGLLEEPLRSLLLDELGKLKVELGDIKGAEDAFRRAEVANETGRALAMFYLAQGEPEKAAESMQKVLNPVYRLKVFIDAVRMGFFSEELAERMLLPGGGSRYKLARLLKFSAFELLEEANKKGDNSLREISKRVFEEGVKVQREFEVSLLMLS
jgi:tetratricopeptide (TPR) repeat protein